MEESKKAPENQDQPKKFFGKFDSVEQAEEGYKELERRLSEQSESVSRMERMLSMMDTPKAESNPKDAYVPVSSYIDEEIGSNLDDTTKRAIEVAVERGRVQTLRDVASYQGKLEAANKQWKIFCDENKDLAHRETLVKAFADQLRSEIGSRKVDDKWFRDEVAKRIRSELGASSNSKPLTVATGTSEERSPRIIRADEEEKMPSEQQIVDDYVNKFREAKSKKLGIKSN